MGNLVEFVIFYVKMTQNDKNRCVSSKTKSDTVFMKMEVPPGGILGSLLLDRHMILNDVN